jgi:hypothetical protein
LVGIVVDCHRASMLRGFMRRRNDKHRFKPVFKFDR